MNSAAVLFANEAFYLAFSTRDYDAMDRIWARRVPVVCIHPGWAALTGRTEIMQSWKGILGNPSTSRVTPHHARVLLQGDVASVVCYEEVTDTILVATNNFVMEDGEIRIIHHQAAPCANPPPPEEKTPPGIQ